MFDCTFIYKFKTGGTSDSLNKKHKVHAVPSIGDTLGFIGENGETTDSVVKEVSHHINHKTGTHEITVYYGDK